ncbi:hypothetical protein TRFO_04935 [Tritrichomonas foetus]|uniref:Vps16 N-terminal domain-containing protein n=1 Tax=Tritrichomonas foetus TaxID=1144522 RepID=A0A1J4KEX1_9EUKA|nr:hypothetical protein TRFO_04935 [Tritrichomonas foetus]|eukprot:OHT08316.1 hypothetical protein TRFO_04935 [Tritrichomonas foetus]
MNLENIKRDWKKFGNEAFIYRKLYDCETHRIAEFEFVPSYHGGLFARFKYGNTIDIFNNAGQLMLTTYLPPSEPIYTVFWCQGANLGILYQTGDISIFSLAGEQITTFKAPEVSYVKFASAFYNGVSVITTENSLCVFDLNLYRYQAFTKIDMTKEITAFTFYRGLKTEGYVAFNDGSIVCITTKSVTEIASLAFIPFKIYASPNANYIAVSAEDKVIIISTQLSPTNYIFDVRASSIAWVTDESLLVVEKQRLHFITIPDFHHAFEIDFTVKMVIQDIDNARIYADTGLFLMQKVPKEIMQLFNNKEIAQVVSIIKEYGGRQISSFKTVLKSEMVQNCLTQMIAAAQVAFDPLIQQQLFYIVAFINTCDPQVSIQNQYTTAMNNVNLLNSLRSHEVGMTTTAASLKYVPLVNYIDIAMSLNLYGWAFELCNLFDINLTPVVERWAYAMLQKNGESALPFVLDRISEYEDIDYRKLANFCIDHHYVRESCTEICDKIFPITDRVMTLSRVIHSEPLDVALKTRDGDSIIALLVHLKTKVSPQRFAQILSGSREATSHFALYQGFEDAKELSKIQNIDKRLLFQWLSITEPPNTFGRNKDRLSSYKTLLDQMGSPLSKWCERQTNFVSTVNRMPDYSQQIKCPSPREVVGFFAANKDFDNAKKITKIYGMSDKYYAQTCARSLAKHGMWEDFKSFISRDSSLKAEDLVDICFEHGNNDLGLIYLQDLQPEIRQKKMELYGIVVV